MLTPVRQEAGDPLTNGRRYSELREFGGKDFRYNSVERRTEVHKQDPDKATEVKATGL